jgi:Gas vesicle synthesis protein GvpL/GvpF
MTPTADTATYLYCLVQADRRPSLAGAPRGLPGTGPLRLLPVADDLWLVAAEAPLRLYGTEPVERGLRDLEWVAARGAAHERVVEHCARRLTTLPMKLFTLFTSDERAVASVRDDEARVRRVLGRVAGHEEWGVRVRLDPALARRRAARRPIAGDGARSSGTKFLLAKKQALDVAREVVREGRAAVEEAFEELTALAAASRRRPGGELDGTRLMLDAALLVPTARLKRFKERARRTVAALAARGYRMSVTGPWPPYNFVGDVR